MKHYLTLTFAVALLGAMSLALSAKTTIRSIESNGEAVRVRVDVDRAVLPAETVEKAIIKIALDCDRMPRRDLRPIRLDQHDLNYFVRIYMRSHQRIVKRECARWQCC